MSQPKLHGATEGKGSSPMGVRKERESSIVGAGTGTGRDCMTSLLL